VLGFAEHVPLEGVCTKGVLL